MDHILVSGANGFIGQALCQHLVSKGFYVRGSIRDRSALTNKDKASDYFETGSLENEIDWTDALHGMDYVIHLAAISEVSKERSTEAPELFQHININTTQRLAAQAAQSGVKRFIYISTIKVNGELSQENAFSPSDLPTPQSCYGKSKLEAEQQVTAICEKTGMETIIIRPTIVYGPGAHGNILRLMKLINTGLPIPLGLVQNKRSLVSIENLCDLIVTCLLKEHLTNRVFLAADGEDISSPDLIRLLAGLMGKKAHLWPVPVPLLKLLGILTFRTGEIRRLTGSLQVDASETRKLLDWTPPYRMKDALKITVEHYLQQRK